jgi:hypothetical protein
LFHEFRSQIVKGMSKFGLVMQLLPKESWEEGFRVFGDDAGDTRFLDCAWGDSLFGLSTFAAAQLVKPKQCQRRRTGVSALHWFWISQELALVPVRVRWGFFAGGVQAGYLLGG